MPLFTRRIPYDRRRLLERAEALADGRRWRRAMRLYRQILAAEPRCIEVHARVAPLLARSGRRAEAWESFRLASEAFAQAGDEAAARTLLQESVRALPLCADACRALARAELARQRRTDAVRVLLAGAKRLARKRRRGEAIVLLRDAREIESWHVPTVLELARLVAKEGLPGEALFLLDHLEQRVEGDELRATRALMFGIEPSLRHGWRWLRSRREGGGVDAPKPSHS